MKKEAVFTTRLRKWMRANASSLPSAAAYEIKVTEDKSIPFDAVSEHQLEALTAVRDGVFTYKIPDAGWQNPFDLFLLREQYAYVVLVFLKKREKASVWFVDVGVFKELQANSEHKSLNESALMRALEEYGPHVRHERF